MRRFVDFVSGFATEVTAAASKVVLEAIRDRLPTALVSDRLKVDGSGVTQPVSGTVAISGTPTISGAVTVTSGAITETNSAAILAKIIAAPATEALQGAGLPAALGAGGGVKVDGSGTALPVSGSVTAAQGTAAAAGAPWFVRLSDGASAIAVALDTTVAAMSAKLPAALGITAAAGSLSIAPASDALFDVKDRAARLLGALTGANGSAIASVTNAVPVGGKDGSGAAQTVLVSSTGIVQTQGATGTAVTSTASEASHVISASACSVSRAAMQNASASTRYLQLHDATSLPANGAVPEAVIIIGTTQTQVMTWSHPNNRFTTGCVAATSSTGPTLTIGSADAIFQVDLFPASA